MSDRDQKPAGTDPSSSRSLSSSELLPLQVSLEKLLGEVVSGLRGGSASVLKLHGLFLEIMPLLQNRDATLVETHRLIGEARLESTNLAEAVRTQSTAVKELITVVIDSRHSVDGAREKLQAIAEEIHTGQHPPMKPEDEPGEAPRWYRVIVVRIADLSWKHKAKIAIPAITAILAWFKATPAIVEAVKLFFGGAP